MIKLVSFHDETNKTTLSSQGEFIYKSKRGSYRVICGTNSFSEFSSFAFYNHSGVYIIK